jgi:GMP synthase (glutamine-hydrolysing)
MHRDAVLDVPEGTVNLGSSPSCGIQGLFKAGQVLSVQAHPEFDDFIMTKIVDRRHEQGIFDDATFKSGMARANLPHDGVLVAEAIWRLFFGRLAI